MASFERQPQNLKNLNDNDQNREISNYTGFNFKTCDYDKLDCESYNSGRPHDVGLGDGCFGREQVSVAVASIVKIAIAVVSVSEDSIEKVRLSMIAHFTEYTQLGVVNFGIW